MAEEPQEQTAIVVGAGPSGLAVSACLNRLSIPNIILEREDYFAPLWTKHSYDRLHLHLAKQACQFPHMPFPTTYPKYVPRTQFIQYIENYMSHFNISPKYHRLVEEANYDESSKKWIVKVKNSSCGGGDHEEFCCRFLIVATGETSDAFVPEVEGLDSFVGKAIHSTQFRSGKEYSERSALVVGAGNSGMEIAFDLSNYGAKTSIVVRSPMHILSKGMMDSTRYLVRFLPINFVEWLITMASKLWYGDLSKYGIKRPKEGPFTVKRKYGKYPIIDVGTYRKIKSGEIQVLPGITRIQGNEVLFENGRSHPFDVIIFATGFRRSTKIWLKGDDSLLNDDGFVKQSPPKHWKGKNGLYCVGLAGRGFYGAALEAQQVAEDINQLL